MKVFLLYCAEGLSRGEIARQCRCTRVLIYMRLRWLRQKLGRHPAELRAYASDIRERAAAASDSRARRIVPRRLVYDSDEEPDSQG